MAGYFVMSSLDIMEISRADILCPSASRPHAFLKLAFVIPSSAALSFIFFTNASSLPATFSAMATAASFPDAIIIHFIISSTVCSSPASKKHCDPPMDAACSLTVTISSRVICPASIASKARRSVITFVTEAGAMASSQFFSNNT